MLKKMNRLVELFGWYGGGAIVLAYILLTFSVLSSTSFIYQFLNLTGALGIVTVSLSKKAYQPALLNIIWSLVALFAIFKIIF
ncbi:transporter [Candidatus Daviesbacteria bacterium]|nr:transporter [Candidatus Daviesbacteria bacterium]